MGDSSSFVERRLDAVNKTKRAVPGGESGIRTHVRVSPKHAFQACAFSHSAISPTTAFLNLPYRRARGPGGYNRKNLPVFVVYEALMVLKFSTIIYSRVNLAAEKRALLSLAIPVALSEIGWMTMTVVDVIMVGNLGPRAIGAVGLGNASITRPPSSALGCCLVSIRWCRRPGARAISTTATARWRRPCISCWLLHRCLCCLSSSRALFLLAVGLTRSSARLPVPMGNPQLGHATAAGLWRIPALSARRGAGASRYICADLGESCEPGRQLDLHLWQLGMPAMGVRGSAISTVIARVYMAAVLVYVAWQHERARGHSLFAHWPGPDWARIRALLKLGVPAATHVILEVAAFGAATILAAHLGAVALATHRSS